MRIYKKNNSSVYRNFIFSLICFAAIIGVFIYVLGNASERVVRENLESTRSAIYKALVTCYSVEGFYPNNISYLEDHYGILIDRKKYEVNYQYVGDNRMPNVQLVEIGSYSV